MRVLLQRVARSSVVVAGETVGSVGRGYCLLVGFTHSDTSDEVRWMAEKVVGLRLFPDHEGKMNLALADVEGGLLVVSQFTLYGDASRGRRPSFGTAARPEHAENLYREFCGALRAMGVVVGEGRFGADMQLEILNDGPVTLMLEREANPGA